MTLRAWWEAGCFLWQASRGYRLRPWCSPYLRWRIETYSGMDADAIRPGTFWGFLWRERRRLADYLRWTGVMRAGGTLQATPRQPPEAP